MNINLKILIFSILLGGAVSAQAATLVSHDFDNGGVGPFHVCTTQNPNYAKVVTERLKTWWTEVGYNGTRMDKGAEVCAADWHTRKEGWYGMTMTLGSDYPTDKKAGVAQIFQFVNEEFWSWAAMLQMDNGDLTIIHRSNGGSSSNVEEVVMSNFPKQQEVDIIIHFVLSAINEGELQIWVDGVSRYHKSNISFGYGDWNSNDEQTGDYTYVDLKAGQYNFQDTEYTSGETRTVYYDNLSWYNGSNGYSIVDPGNGDTPVTQSPYTNHAIPGLIQAEDYDVGGEGLAYHDTSSGNTGTAYRTDGVDIQNTTDIGGGQNVGWIANGEWLEYTIGSVSSGTYDIHLRVAASGTSNDKSVALSLDNSELGDIEFAGTGGWQSWETITLDNVNINSGSNKVLRVDITGVGFNLNSIEFVRSEVDEEERNLALGQWVTQSSTGWNGEASRAVDGNSSGVWSQSSVTHTLSESEAWLEVDLGSVKNIDTLYLWNRTDCCASRLSNFYVLVSDYAFNSTDLSTSRNQSGVTSYQYAGTAGELTQFSVNRSGRYVRVQLAGTNPLSLAEVEIMGTDSGGSSVSVSASSDDGNVAENVLDDNTATRWSANGSGEWLQFDLGATRSVSAIELAFFKGSERSANFDIQASTNGANWNTVLSSASSSGSSTSLEYFSFGAVNARYIRYVGYGNSTNSWNSITEANVVSN